MAQETLRNLIMREPLIMKACIKNNLKTNTFSYKLEVLFIGERMAKGIFITATGTDAGKTFISALIVKKLREACFNCGYYKPVLSGAEIIAGQLVPGDCAYVVKTAGLNGNPSDYSSYIFKTAVSPHLAAEIEGVSITKEKIKNDFEQKKKIFDYIVVEGAGGIICPFNLKMNPPLLLPDIIKLLNLDVIIVAGAELGSINSAVLTAEYLKHAGISAKGIILNRYNENDFMQKDNREQIEKLTGINVIAASKENDTELNIDTKTLLSLFKEI